MSAIEPLLPPELGLDGDAPFDIDELTDQLVHFVEVGGSTLDDLVAEMLAAGEEPEPDVELDIQPARREIRWRPTDDAGAEWCMALAAQALAEKVAAQARFDGMVAKLQRARARNVVRPDATLTVMAALLERYAIDERIRTDGKRKTVVLPSGDVKTTRGTVPKYELIDDEAFEVWAANSLTAEQYEACVKTTVAPKMDPLKLITSVEPADEDEAWSPTARVLLDGEPVAGIQAVLPTTTATIKPDIT